MSVVQSPSSTTVKETCPPSSQHGHYISQFANAKFSFTAGSDRTSVPPANNNSVTPKDAAGKLILIQTYFLTSVIIFFQMFSTTY